jgi:phosphorylcholine metabolism protein LicD
MTVLSKFKKDCDNIFGMTKEDYKEFLKIAENYQKKEYILNDRYLFYVQNRGVIIVSDLETITCNGWSHKTWFYDILEKVIVPEYYKDVIPRFLPPGYFSKYTDKECENILLELLPKLRSLTEYFKNNNEK